MDVIHIALVATGALLVAATVLTVIPTSEWWVRIFDFPRLQIALLLAAVLGAYLWLYGDGEPIDYPFVAAVAASLAYQVVRIYPYTFLIPKQVPDADEADASRRLRLLISNVLQPNRRADLLLARIDEQDPDVVLVVESDFWWDERLRALDDRYPHRVKVPQDNTYGMHLFSRLELDDVRVRYLRDEDVPSIFARMRLPSGDWIQFCGIHPRPPRMGQDTDLRDEELIMVGRFARTVDLPIVVAGDLNDVAWSRSSRRFRRISGLCDPRIGRGWYATFHARYPFARWALDHVFIGQAFRVAELRRLPYVGSDHFPVMIALSLRPKMAEATHPENVDGPLPASPQGGPP